MSSSDQRKSLDLEEWRFTGCDFKESAIMDWIMSNTRRFHEMAATQEDFPFLLTQKTSATCERADVVKKYPGGLPKQDKVSILQSRFSAIVMFYRSLDYLGSHKTVAD